MDCRIVKVWTAVVFVAAEVAIAVDVAKEFHFHSTYDSGNGANRWHRNPKLQVTSM